MDTRVVKPWGEEVILSPPNSPYNLKALYLKAGKRWSLQYHDQKTETLVLVSGQAKIIINQDTSDMVINQGYTILPNIIHRVEAQTDAVIIEASTPEIGTTFRLQDDYARTNETEELRTLPNRGWQNG